MMRAIGAAARAPKPPFSTMMARAILGLSTGAKAMNQEWSRWRSATFFSSYFSFCFMAMTCAVPVLPPLVYWAPAKARAGAFLVHARHRALHELDMLWLVPHAAHPLGAEVAPL